MLPFIRDLRFTAGELIPFERILQVRNFKKGEMILSSGEDEKEFRFVYKGLVRFYYQHEGKEINTQFAQENEIVCSFSSYSSRTPSLFNIQALESTTLVCFTREEMDNIMIQGPKYLQFGISLMNFMFTEKEKREMELLNYDALGRLQQFLDKQPGLFLKLPQTYIASYLNIRPETLSALKRKLINKSSKD